MFDIKDAIDQVEAIVVEDDTIGQVEHWFAQFENLAIVSIMRGYHPVGQRYVGDEETGAVEAAVMLNTPAGLYFADNWEIQRGLDRQGLIDFMNEVKNGIAVTGPIEL